MHISNGTKTYCNKTIDLSIATVSVDIFNSERFGVNKFCSACTTAYRKTIKKRKNNKKRK